MKMNCRVQQGFSLTELLIVISIIIILAGFTIGSLPGIQNRINRGNVEAFLQEIQSGLSRYQIEYGNYPINEPGGASPSDRDATGLVGAAVLYKHLSGDFDEDGEIDEDGDIYIQKLGGKYNENSKTKRSIVNPSGSGYVIVDSFNSPIRYLAEKPNVKDKKTKNPTFDIWSIVDTNPSQADTIKAQANYITNWTR